MTHDYTIWHLTCNMQDILVGCTILYSYVLVHVSDRIVRVCSNMPDRVILCVLLLLCLLLLLCDYCLVTLVCSHVVVRCQIARSDVVKGGEGP